MMSSRSIVRLSTSLALVASVGGAALDASTAAAAPQSCPDTSSGIVSYPTAPVVCLTQPGNVVIVILGSAANPGATTTVMPALPALAGMTPLTGDPINTSRVTPSASTYAQRQAVRDRYRGQIDELTFNDELGDGVSVYQALSDAMAARVASPHMNTP